MWYIYTMKYYSVTKKKNERIPFATTRMGLEIIILSEVSQIENDKYHMVYQLYVESKQMIQMNVVPNRLQKQTYGFQRGKARGGIN